MDTQEKIHFMLQTMSQKGVERAYVLIQRLWLRFGETGTRTHMTSSQKEKDDSE